jgi:hypothetical protein
MRKTRPATATFALSGYADEPGLSVEKIATRAGLSPRL